MLTNLDTLRLLGMLENTPQDTPLIDLTHHDLPELKAEPTHIYQLSSSIDSSSPCKTMSDEMMDFFTNGMNQHYEDVEMMEQGQGSGDFSNIRILGTSPYPSQPYQMVDPVSNTFYPQMSNVYPNHRPADEARSIEVVDLTMLD